MQEYSSLCQFYRQVPFSRATVVVVQVICYFHTIKIGLNSRRIEVVQFDFFRYVLVHVIDRKQDKLWLCTCLLIDCANVLDSNQCHGWNHVSCQDKAVLNGKQPYSRILTAVLTLHIKSLLHLLPLFVTMTQPIM